VSAADVTDGNSEEVAHGGDEEEAAWLELVGRFDAPASFSGALPPWPERENLAAPDMAAPGPAGSGSAGSGSAEPATAGVGPAVLGPEGSGPAEAGFAETGLAEAGLAGSGSGPAQDGEAEPGNDADGDLAGDGPAGDGPAGDGPAGDRAAGDGPARGNSIVVWRSDSAGNGSGLTGGHGTTGSYGAAGPAPSGRDYHIDDEEEEHFVPPPPPPLPNLTPVAKGAWAGLFGGPGYLLVATLTGWSISGLAMFLAIAAFIGGFAILVLHLGDGSDRDSGSDDGAVV